MNESLYKNNGNYNESIYNKSYISQFNSYYFQTKKVNPVDEDKLNWVKKSFNGSKKMDADNIYFDNISSIYDLGKTGSTKVHIKKGSYDSCRSTNAHGQNTQSLIDKKTCNSNLSKVNTNILFKSSYEIELPCIKKEKLIKPMRSSISLQKEMEIKENIIKNLKKKHNNFLDIGDNDDKDEDEEVQKYLQRSDREVERLLKLANRKTIFEELDQKSKNLRKRGSFELIKASQNESDDRKGNIRYKYTYNHPYQIMSSNLKSKLMISDLKILREMCDNNEECLNQHHQKLKSVCKNYNYSEDILKMFSKN